jgi:NADH:ubiquinone reductase (H+-translocating)
MNRLVKLGTLSGGAALGGWLLQRSRASRQRVNTFSRTHRLRIVVAGAGFAGISTLQALSKRIPRGAAEITLVDQHNYHLFTPLLYQVATGAVDSTNLTYSLRRFCAYRGITFVCSQIYGINAMDQILTTASGQIPYDYLVLGLGSQTNYFGMDEVEQRSFGLKTVPDAMVLRRQIVRNFERAAQLVDPDVRRRLLSFVVVGGGATGVELTGSLHELVQHNLLRYYPEIAPDEARIILVEAGSRVLPGLDDRMGQMTLHRFEEIGIDVRLNTMVAGARDGAVITRDGDQITGEVIVWTAGIRPHPIAAGLAVEKARDGRVVVDEHLRVPGLPSIFAMGDIAASTDSRNGNPLPPNAAVAVQEGESTGANLARLVRGEPMMPFVYEPMGELIALGRLRAAADLGPFVFDGLLAWFIWRVVYLTKLMGAKNRVGLVIDWFASLFAQREIVDTDHHDLDAEAAR